MSIEIIVPELGESVTEATVAQWLKAAGEAVSADEPLLELETDKATLEIVAPKAGVLIEIKVADGEDVEVGAVLGVLDESAEATVAAPTSSPTVEPTSESAPPSEAPAASAPPNGAPNEIARTGAGGSIALPDLLAYVGRGSSDALERSGPAVRNKIAEAGLDPTTILATGRDGRIQMEDVLEALETGGAPVVATAEAPNTTTAVEPQPPREERVKMTRMRRTIATRLKEAQNTAAMLTTFNEVDMSRVLELRARHKDAFLEHHGVKLGFTGFFAKAVVAALQAVPAVNGEIEEDEIVYKYHYDLGMAVSTPSGLVVPVIKDCDQKSFAEIEGTLLDHAAAAREGKLAAEDMSGGTFSITNGGVFGSLLSTPILNRPQSAILGLHKIQERPMVVDGEICVRPMMYLALSYDHRIIDGREAVTFLVKVKEGIEDPDRMLLGL